MREKTRQREKTHTHTPIGMTNGRCVTAMNGETALRWLLFLYFSLYANRKYPNRHISDGSTFGGCRWRPSQLFFSNKIADGANVLFSFMLHYVVYFVGTKRFIIGSKMAHLLALKKRAPNSNDEGTQVVLANQTVRGNERYCQIGSTLRDDGKKLSVSKKNFFCSSFLANR